MNLHALLAVLSAVFVLSQPAFAQTEEFDPYAPNAEELLEQFDAVYEAETGLSSHLEDSSTPPFLSPLAESGCYRETCAVWAQIVKSTQTMYLYIDGVARFAWPVSTGIAGRSTPNFDKHPDGRIYNRYTSTKFPGGDYNGLGNMPYAVFIHRGFAIHGTPRGNWPRLGRPASHGCIRVHPDNGQYFNQLVRAAGVRNTWITVQP